MTPRGLAPETPGVLARREVKPAAEVAVQVALVGEAGGGRDLRDRHASLEHPAGEADALRELVAVRRHPGGGPEQAHEPELVRSGRGGELVERDPGCQVV